MSEAEGTPSGLRALPRLILVADGFATSDLRLRIEEAVVAGIRWIHLRDHGASEQAFAAAAREVAGIIRSLVPDALISINGRLDVAAELGAGFHTGARGPHLKEAARMLGTDAILGYSAHSAGEAAAAFRESARYVLASPVYPTSSKPGQPGIGVEGLRAFARQTHGGPVYALGGVSPERVPECLDAGSYGVAVLSGILATPDVTAAARAYLQALGPRTP